MGDSAVPPRIRSMGQLRKYYYGARLQEELFPLLRMEAHRDKFAETLASTYFDQVMQQDMLATVLQPKTGNDENG